jgi:hypothetical protein
MGVDLKGFFSIFIISSGILVFFLELSGPYLRENDENYDVTTQSEILFSFPEFFGTRFTAFKSNSSRRIDV